MSAPAEPLQPRSVAPTGFTDALDALMDAVPEALCATFVDAEGETIDLATRVDPYDAQVYSAELALPLARLRGATRELRLGPPAQVRLVGERRSAVIARVADGCDLLLVLASGSSVPRAARECALAARRLQREAGLREREAPSIPPEGPRGEAPRAFVDDGRTRAVAQVVGARDHTVGESMLVRTAEGDECLVVRDPATQRWYRA